MKKKRLIVSLFFLCIIKIYAQDLEPYTGAILSNTLTTSDYFHISFTIKNSGVTSAQQNYVGIRISQNNNGTGLISLGFISLEQIEPGQVSSLTEYKLPLPLTIQTGTYYVYIIADNFGEIGETDETNNAGILAGTINVTNDGTHTRINLPYPILFVHGWIGDNTAWLNFADSILNKQYGWSNGGVLDYCLNYDNNVYTGELYNDFHDYVEPAYTRVGDYYFINFDIDANGNWWDYVGHNYNTPSQSNQSAIVKQGYAVGNAIIRILSLTGRDKVILMGHSMGGLASREYLQRWTLNDGETHVAKLVTCGTPNQGANSTQWGLGVGDNTDEKSEAVRDLRRSYFSSGQDGAYLFGGWETDSWIQNNILFTYHNVDVNCNGIEGEYVNGLDYEDYQDINYSCVIGTGDECSIPGGGSINSDGVVEDWSANLYNGFLNGSSSPNYVDTFWVNSYYDYDCGNADFLHTRLNKSEYWFYNMQALDESDFYDDIGYGHSYEIEFNKLYYGVIAEKSRGAYYGTTYDYDDYKFTQTITSNIEVNVYNINIPNMIVRIYSSGNFNTPYYTTSSNGKGNVYFQLNNVPTGEYYFEIMGTPTTDLSVYRAYGFEISNSLVTIVTEEEVSYFDVKVFPNPSSGIFKIDITADSNESFLFEIMNVLGQVVYSESNVSVGIHEINPYELSSGIYVVRVSNTEKVMTKNIVISK